jgi:hypothetical protein
MGLDMNLFKKTYIGNKYKKEDEKVKLIGDRAKDIDIDKISYITEDIGYWRKANAIHKWFVDNVQDGNDDCGEHYVSKEQLKELLGLVNRVLDGSKLIKGKIQNGYHCLANGKEEPIMEDGEFIEDPTLAKELLPTEEGFFFGMTNYDQWYIDSLKETKTILEDVLKSGEKDLAEYYYSSSW